MTTALRKSDENSQHKMLKDPDAVGIFDGFSEGVKGIGKDDDDDSDGADANYDEVVDRVEVAQIKKRVAPLRYPGTKESTAAAAADDPAG